MVLHRCYDLGWLSLHCGVQMFLICGKTCCVESFHILGHQQTAVLTRWNLNCLKIAGSCGNFFIHRRLPGLYRCGLMQPLRLKKGRTIPNLLCHRIQHGAMLEKVGFNFSAFCLLFSLLHLRYKFFDLLQRIVDQINQFFDFRFKLLIGCMVCFLNFLPLIVNVFPQAR